MKVLAIETATQTGAVALIDDEEIICEYTYPGRLEHSAGLMSAIDRLLSDAHLFCQQIDGLVVSSGPGSFTGLRIGISTAKGLAYGLDIPIVGVSTLDSLACNLPFTSKIIAPILDAKKKEVYVSLYKVLTTPQRLTDYLVIPPQKLIEIIDEPTIFLGNGLKVYQEQIRQVLKDVEVYFAPSSLWKPRASHLALLGLERLKSGQQEDISSFAPLYLRKPYEGGEKVDDKTP